MSLELCKHVVLYSLVPELLACRGMLCHKKEVMMLIQQRLMQCDLGFPLLSCWMHSLSFVFIQSCGNLFIVNINTLLFHLIQFSIDFIDLHNMLVWWKLSGMKWLFTVFICTAFTWSFSLFFISYSQTQIQKLHYLCHTCFTLLTFIANSSIFISGINKGIRHCWCRTWTDKKEHPRFNHL